MDEYKTNIIKSVLFFLVIVGLLIGGYYLLKNFEPHKKNEKSKAVNESKIMKIDDKSEYIYYDNYKVISGEPDITYKDVIINIVGNEELNKTLKSEMDEIRQSVKYISDNTLDETKEVLYEEENVFYAKERNYENINTLKYISLVIKDYEFNCYDGTVFIGGKSYIYDRSDGSLLTEEKIFSIYDINKDKVKELVTNKLNELKNGSEDVEFKIDETLENLNVFYYINYKGLNVGFLVKTSTLNTLENIIIE